MCVLPSFYILLSKLRLYFLLLSLRVSTVCSYRSKVLAIDLYLDKKFQNPWRHETNADLDEILVLDYS